MKIAIVFKKGLDESAITFDTRQLAKNYINILKSGQKSNPGLGLADLYYPEDLNDYIESVLDDECIDSDFYYEYSEDVEKLIEETALDVDDLLIKYDC